MSTLPTSVSSSCTVFTSTAGGNVPGTMFNAALANISGVFISPLLISLLLSTSGQGLPADEVIRILINLFIKNGAADNCRSDCQTVCKEIC